jgi:ribose 5-phosphate isomerase A
MVSMSNSPTPASPSPRALTQDELKTLVGQAALDYVVRGQWVGVGTGSTVNKFIDALGSIRHEIACAVSSSLASTSRICCFRPVLTVARSKCQYRYR